MQEQRLEAIFTDLVDAIRRVIREHRVTDAEYRAAVDWLTEAGTQLNEISLLLGIFLEMTVDDVNFDRADGTQNSVEGPFYVPDAPLLQPPYVLPMRPDEPGERLHFCGTVRSSDGRSLPGAMLDLWQVSADGGYSNFHPGFPDGNLRGRLLADGQGRFEVETVVPVPYEVPKEGATGHLLAMLGRSAYRPAHLHLKVTHEEHRPLTTQMFFTGDPWLGRDVVAGADKPSLAATLVRDSSGIARCSYDLVLDPVAVSVPA